MAAIVIVGAQWGDEGKGKAPTEHPGRQVDYVVKPNGGNNAGTQWSLVVKSTS